MREIYTSFNTLQISYDYLREIYTSFNLLHYEGTVSFNQIYIL